MARKTIASLEGIIADLEDDVSRARHDRNDAMRSQKKAEDDLRLTKAELQSALQDIGSLESHIQKQEIKVAKLEGALVVERKSRDVLDLLFPKPSRRAGHVDEVFYRARGDGERS
jgi:chromosome segregation ATPase